LASRSAPSLYRPVHHEPSVAPPMPSFPSIRSYRRDDNQIYVPRHGRSASPIQASNSRPDSMHARPDSYYPNHRAIPAAGSPVPRPSLASSRAVVPSTRESNATGRSRERKKKKGVIKKMHASHSSQDLRRRSQDLLVDTFEESSLLGFLDRLRGLKKARERGEEQRRNKNKLEGNFGPLVRH
ncbi:hypothetical protein BT69DRAFT_1286856, partial [Atractiella rhizophila]